MYHAIEGNLIEKKTTQVVLKAGPIFYEIKISLNTYTSLKDEKQQIKLYTYLLVKEDKLVLYGFSNLEEKTAFLMLIQVSGISTISALILLSSLKVDDIYRAIQQEEVDVFQQVKGIGIKTAKRIILDLKDKVQKMNITDSNLSNLHLSTLVPHEKEAISALVKLGLDKKVAHKNIQAVLKKYGTHLDLEDLIKYGLKS